MAKLNIYGDQGFAELDSNNVVLRMIAVSPVDAPDEETGIAFCKSLFGEDTIWIQATDIAGRKNGAGTGFTYNASIDAFFAPKRYPSWTLSSSTGLWEPPVDYPADSYEATGQKPPDNYYEWNESEQQWDNVTERGPDES